MSDDPKPPSPNFLRERADALQIIEAWENQLKILLDEYQQPPEVETEEGEEQPQRIPEIDGEALHDRLEGLRDSLFVRLRGHFSKADKDLPSKTYEEIVYTLISDRMRRYYGYYEAIRRAEEDARQLNHEAGDQVFKIDINSIQKLLSSVDEIYFIKYLCTGLGLEPTITDRIVNHQIDREFKPKTK